MKERTRPVFTPPEGPPQGVSPSREIYPAMGEENIFLMLRDFYAELGKSEIRPMFADDLEKASERSAAFFVFLLGGPPLFHQRYGPPMMRGRHIPFEIDEKSRRIWLTCFDTILLHAPEKYNFPKEHLEGFRLFLEHFSGWMVNTK